MADLNDTSASTESSLVSPPRNLILGGDASIDLDENGVALNAWLSRNGMRLADADKRSGAEVTDTAARTSARVSDAGGVGRLHLFESGTHGDRIPIFAEDDFVLFEVDEDDPRSIDDLWSTLPDGNIFTVSLSSRTVLKTPCIENLVDFISKRVSSEPTFIMDVTTVLQELLNNAVIHGNYGLSVRHPANLDAIAHLAEQVDQCHGDPDFYRKRVMIGVQLHARQLSISIHDEGAGFMFPDLAPTTAPGIRVDRRASGRGLKIVERLCNRLDVTEGVGRVTATLNSREPAFRLGAVEQEEARLQNEIRASVTSGSVLIYTQDRKFGREVYATLRQMGYDNISCVMSGISLSLGLEMADPDLLIVSDPNAEVRMLQAQDGRNASQEQADSDISLLSILREVRLQGTRSDLPILVLGDGETTLPRPAPFRTGIVDIIDRHWMRELFEERLPQHLEHRLLLSKLRSFHSRINNELDVARQMQSELLPTVPEVKELSGHFNVSIDMHYRPSSELGGDSWGLVDLGGNGFAVFLVDFSGHGVGAAMNTFRLHTLLTGSSQALTNPALLLGLLNRSLVDLLPRGQFATMIYAVIDPRAGVIRYASAGATQPICCYPDIGDDDLIHGDSAGLPLGVRKLTNYEERSLPIPTGGFMFLYSDAILEAQDKDTGEPLGPDKLRSLVRLAVQEHGDGRPPLDDLVARFDQRTGGNIDDDLSAVWISF